MITPTRPLDTLDAREFIDAFESGAIGPGEFHHREHVRLAWSYLRCHSLLETLELLSGAIRRFAEANGAHGLYHETITWAYVMVIDSRLPGARAAKTDIPFEGFARANEDLFEWPSPILSRHYRDETIWSESAREHFIWPDRTGPRHQDDV